MGIGAAAFRDNQVPMGVSAIAPPNQTNLGINAAADLPRGDGVLMEGVGRMEMSFAGAEEARMNAGDVGFFGSQVANTMSEATGAFLGAFRDKSEDGPAVQSQELEVLQQQQLTASMANRNFTLG